MGDLQMWELIVGFISATFIIPIIQQPQWTEKRRSLVTFVYAIVVGLVTAYMSGGMDTITDVKSAVSAVLLLFVSAIATYKGLAKPYGIAPRIEEATSSAPSSPPA